ncbi:MAG: AMP-binding protein [Alphaproteobacteria bacterium]
MLDVGHALLQAAERAPNAAALVDGSRRWTYGELLADVRGLAGGLLGLGLASGDRVISLYQNTAEAAFLHWACQLSGIAIVPLNWRATAAELDYCAENADAKAIFFQDVSAEATSASTVAPGLIQVAVGDAFEKLLASPPIPPKAHGDVEAWSVMLYTSGTTGRPKGVPRVHRAERAAAIAHVAQYQFGRGERSLGVMPLYHTMGVRSLLAAPLVDGCFVCQPRFSPEGALALIEAERISHLIFVPTLFHDLVSNPNFVGTDTASVKKLGFAGASMTDGLLKRLVTAFEPDLFVNHYGSSEIYTFTIDPDAPAKPGSAGRAGLNQTIRVVTLGGGPTDLAAVGEEGEIIADLAGDEAFQGYWRRPDADAKSLRDGWYFTSDTGYFDEDGDLFVTGRVDDMIITGGENVSPVEIESLLSLHPAVAEVAVAGVADERWGQVVAAFIKRGENVTEEVLDEYCRTSGLANFKRPRRYVFVSDIPKSPVGKILRRLLQSGDYQEDRS